MRVPVSQLLSQSNKSIIEIAEGAGYQSEAAFSRVFKKYVQTPPAAYRRKSQLSQIN
ncbi:MAG: helix-turn-helix domain-containing protein [Desulfobulbia bacterium]